MLTELTDKERKRKAVEAQKKWREKNPEKYKLARSKARLDNKKRRLLVITHYGGKCACCGEPEIMFLGIDHINGGGKKHRHEVGNGSSDQLYRWIIKNYPDDLQVLCHNCNLAKGFYGSCPHNNAD